MGRRLVCLISGRHDFDYGYKGYQGVGFGYCLLHGRRGAHAFGSLVQLIIRISKEPGLAKIYSTKRYVENTTFCEAVYEFWELMSD